MIYEHKVICDRCGEIICDNYDEDVHNDFLKDGLDLCSKCAKENEIEMEEFLERMRNGEFNLTW